MFGIFKKNPASAVAVGTLLLLLLWARSFFGPPAVADDAPMMPLECWLMPLVERYPLFSTIAAFLLLYVLGLMLIQLNNRHFFASEQAYLPPFIFALSCSAFPILHGLNGAYAAAFFFVLGLFFLLKLYKNERVFSSIFLAFALFSVASLFFAPAIFLLLLIPPALLLLRTPTEWRDWAIALGGAALPYLYTFVLYLVTDNDGFTIFHMLSSALLSPSGGAPGDGGVVAWVYLCYLLLVVLLAVLMLARGLMTSRIKVQKIHALFAWAFFILLLSMLLLPLNAVMLVPLTALPASVLMANYFALSKYRRIAGLLFWALILLTFAVQYWPQ